MDTAADLEDLGPADGQTGRQSLYKQGYELKIKHCVGNLGRSQPTEQWEESVETGANSGGQAVGGGGRLVHPYHLLVMVCFSSFDMEV